MKTIKYISLILIALSISCCVNQKKKDEEQIKNTVAKYWSAVKDNDLERYKDLFDENENYAGAIQSDLYFLHKNYDKINPHDVLLKNYKIKDTTVMFAENKQKYVQFIVVTKNDPNNLKKDLIITLMFYKPVGFDKIYNLSPLQNHIGWGKDE